MTDPPQHPDPALTRAEIVASIGVATMAASMTAAYLADRLGFGVSPIVAAVAAPAAAAIAWGALRHNVEDRVPDIAVFLLVVAGTLGYLLWLAWPALLPLGSGSDLTHHLLLVDYAERQGHLPHDPSAIQYLGEMTDYTPGLHLLAVVAGALARTDGLHAIYPLVACSVALKCGVFLLILLRLLRPSPLGLPLALGGVIAVFATSTYSLGSFVSDSFLAQVLSELFAVAAWWALVWWDAQPRRAAMGLFAIAGIAAFLTWPIWIGPPVLTLALVVLTRIEMPFRIRTMHAAIALVPIGAVVVLHSIGRIAQVSIVGTSGAVVPPSIAVLGWLLPALSIGGWLLAAATRRTRATAVFAAAIVVQAAALWFVAAGQTPYMAIKMTYLAIYPAIALAVLLVDATARAIVRISALAGRRAVHAVVWFAVLAVATAVRHDLPSRAGTRPALSNDLNHAGLWARTHLPAGCVDYLVGNEYTAYWLHLAVLGNPRISSRTGDDDTFRTQPSMARWLAKDGIRYAIANLNVLPAEIRNDVEVLQQFGQAAVIERRGASTCPAP